MYIPNPYMDPTFPVYMAMTFPLQSYVMLPALMAASTNMVRAASLPPVWAATAWNLAVLSVLAGCDDQKPAKPA